MNIRKQLFMFSTLICFLFGIFYLIGVQNILGHESRLYTIGNEDFWITVGSMNEPVYVDDKSGAEAFVRMADPANPLDRNANGTKMLEGLEKTLKFEISAGDKKKILEIEPAFNDPGHYEAVFYPTIETTYNYRLFGTINNVTLSLDFQCSTAEGEGNQDNSTKQISEGVTQKSQTGAFGCVTARTDASFPEPYISNNEIMQMINQSKGNSSSN